MARYVIMPEAIDDSFIAVMVEELLRGEGSSHHGRHGTEDDTSYGEILPDDDTALGVEALAEEIEAGDQAWESAVQRQAQADSSRPPSPPRAKRAASGGQWRLRILEEESGVEHLVRLGAKPITIGRSRENSVVVQCPRVSRRHLRFWVDESGLNVENLAEHNRMRVNGRKLVKATLEANDVIRIGLVRIRVERIDQPGNSTDKHS